jgi:hypothetical protein
MDSTLDLLQRAALRLAQEGSIKDRLADAYTLHLSEVDANELPELVRHEFITMCDAMHRERPLPRESVIRASVRKMSNDEARQHAALVVRAFAARRSGRRGHAPRDAQAGSAHRAAVRRGLISPV